MGMEAVKPAGLRTLFLSGFAGSNPAPCTKSFYYSSWYFMVCLLSEKQKLIPMRLIWLQEPLSRLQHFQSAWIEREETRLVSRYFHGTCGNQLQKRERQVQGIFWHLNHFTDMWSGLMMQWIALVLLHWLEMRLFTGGIPRLGRWFRVLFAMSNPQIYLLVKKKKSFHWQDSFENTHWKSWVNLTRLNHRPLFRF